MGSSINRITLAEIYKLKVSQMPFLYRTQIKQSAIEGRGVFALEDIPKGSIYWAWECPKDKEIPTKGYQPSQNLTFDKQSIKLVTDTKRLAQILHGGFYYEGSDIFIDLRDGTHFMNHNENYNSQIIYNAEKDYTKLVSIAWRDIKAGDEITQSYGNYSSINGKWVTDLMEKYSPGRISFQKSINKAVKPFGVRNR